VDPVPTEYIDRDGAALAYQVVGSGPTNVVMIGELTSHLDMLWTDPHFHRFFERLASFSRCILFQRRGFGMSVPVPYTPTIEQQAEDIVAVMDAVGMPRATLCATFGTCGAMALVAATNPDRVQNLLLIHPFVIGPLHPDAAAKGWSTDEITYWATEWREAFGQWGSGRTVEVLDPGMATGYNRRLMGMLERCSATPSAAMAYFDWTSTIDITDVLAAVKVPTRVLHWPSGLVPDRVVQQAAELIDGADYVRLPENPVGAALGELWIPVSDHVAELATGRPRLEDVDRFLGTVLFTDIVGSTELLARLGDSSYRELRASYERLVRLIVDAAGGRVVSVTGDGTFSLFEGPNRAVRAAEEVCTRSAERGVLVRSGVHTGQLERTALDVTGMTVHVGARVAAMAGAGEVLVSQAVRDLAMGSGLIFRNRGKHNLKGMAGVWELYSLVRAGQQEITASAASPAPTVIDRAALRMAQRAPRLARRAVAAGNALQRRRAKLGS
jgi:class 3 adenylate cyclase/pimeloyl-ACP methyl ester carboxylesterase